MAPEASIISRSITVTEAGSSLVFCDKRDTVRTTGKSAKKGSSSGSSTAFVGEMHITIASRPKELIGETSELSFVNDTILPLFLQIV
jgi:hypothetical protein